MESLKGQLLIAAPPLVDPNFTARSSSSSSTEPREPLASS